jgi:ATP-dependent exoDNAse (exonuclease V) alpha subunit
MPTAAECQRACRLRKSAAITQADKQNAMELESVEGNIQEEQEEVMWSKPSIHDTSSFQLGFSMTVHKAQGRTIDKLC